MTEPSDSVLWCLNHSFIGDSQAASVVEEICDFIEYANQGSEARIGNMRGLSRVGKTGIIRKVMSKYEKHTKDGVQIHPILYLKVAGTPTIKDILQRCLEQLGVPVLPRDSVPALIDRLAHYIKLCGVKLIVLDEFQHLIVVRGTSITGLYDSIKSILNQCRCPILSVGTNISMEVINADPQLRGRCIYQRQLKSFRARNDPSPENDDEDAGPSFKEYVHAIKCFLKIANLTVDRDLLHGALADDLFENSRGLYGRTIDIITKVLVELTKKNKTEVTRELVQRVIRRMPPMEDPSDTGMFDEVIFAVSKSRQKPKRSKMSHLIARAEEMKRPHRQE